jgi:hypothetical protein
MGKTNLVQLVVVMNSPSESFEVTKWYDLGKGDPKRMRNELVAIAKKLYSVVLEERGQQVPKEMMIGVGESSQELDTREISSLGDITEKVHYALYEGHCLDRKKLSYFIPEKTLAEGEMTTEKIRNL